MEVKKVYIDGNQYVYSSNPTKKLNRRWQVVDNFNIKREVKKVKVKEAIEKSLLVDIVKQIDKCFKDYVRQHLDRDIPCNLDMLSNSIVSNIEKIFEEAG